MITKLYNKLKNKDEDLAFGLIFGLAFGLIFGLASGLASGLVGGLAFGLAFGLVGGLAFGLVGGLAFGLVSGLAFGLVYGLAFGLAIGLINLSSLIPINWISIVLLIVGVLILSELFVLTYKRKKRYSLRRVLTIKLECLFTSLLIIINSLNLVWIIRKVDWDKYFPVIIKWLGYIGIGIICLALVGLIIYLWIKLNQKILKR